MTTRRRTGDADDAADLDHVLAPYLYTGLPVIEGSGRFIDTPPAVVREALSLLDPDVAQGRPNGQPPAHWLMELADRLGGLLGGSFSTAPWVGLRVDAIQVPRPMVGQLAQSVLDAWPAYDDWPAAIDLADAEGWPAWDAERSEWEGLGRDLLGDLPELAVFGLWWD